MGHDWLSRRSKLWHVSNGDKPRIPFACHNGVADPIGNLEFNRPKRNASPSWRITQPTLTTIH